MAAYRTDQYRTAFRATLHPDYKGISDEQADALLESVTADMTPQEADAYMEGLGSWFRHAASTVAKTAPIWAPIAGAAVGSIVPGAGTAVGGMVGGLVGNVAGRLATGGRVNAGAVAGSALQGVAASGVLPGGAGGGLATAALGMVGSALNGGTQARPPGRPAPGAPRPGAAPAPAAAAPPAASRPAARQLMTLLNSPHLGRAVLGQVNGPVGRSAVPVPTDGRRHQVAFGSFINALLHLAQQAVAELTAPDGGTDSYLTTSEGTYAYDPASPEQRAEGLLALLETSYDESYPTDEREEAYAEASAYDPLTEWFLDSGLIRR